MNVQFIYKENLRWISQIQSIRNELNQFKQVLKDFQINSDKLIERNSLTERILDLNNKLDSMETLLLASLNNGTTYWAGHQQTYDVPKIPIVKNRFLDKMKNAYCEYIDLHKSMVIFL